MLKKRLAAVAIAIAAVIAPIAITAPAQAAIDSRCSITPRTPYKVTGGFTYGATVNCSASVAKSLSVLGQRQSTLSWVNIASVSNSTSSSGVSSLSAYDIGSCISGSSTYRSRATAMSSNGGSSTVSSTGGTVSC